MLATNRFMYEKKRAKPSSPRMYQAANRWMKKPTPVMTPSIVSDSASSFTRERRCERADLHPGPQRFAICALRAAIAKSRPTCAVTNADRPMLPTPMIAATRSDMRSRANVSSAKPDEREDEDQRNEIHAARHPFIVVAASTSSVRKRR